MKLTKQDVFLLLIGVLIVLNIFNTNKIKTDITSYENKIELLQTKIDSTTTLNKTLNNKIDLVNIHVTKITDEINQIDNNILILRQKTNEKIKIVDIYTASELEQFFTDRYNRGKTE
jgi:septal ring factor EnvC (AmiA/AmiB activator)